MAVSFLNKTYRVKKKLPGQRLGAKAGTSTFVTRFQLSVDLFGALRFLA